MNKKKLKFLLLPIIFIYGIIFSILTSEIFVRIFIRVNDVGPSLTEYDPVYGKKIKKNFIAIRKTPEFTMNFSSNSLGFRGDKMESYPERPILFLGDSFTMGFGVNDGEVFTDHVQKYLDENYGKGNIRVINAGIGDTGNGRWLKFLNREGIKLNPRLVVLQLHETDFNDNLLEGFYQLTEKNELKETSEFNKKGKITRKIFDSLPFIQNLHLYGLIRQIKVKRQAGSLSGITKNDSLTYHIIEEIVRTSTKNNWPVFVVVVDNKEERLAGVSKIFDKNEVEFTNIEDASIRPDIYYKLDGHWNKKGHILVAEKIIQYLDSSPVLR